MTKIVGQLCELLREGVQGNKNNLLNQDEGGNLGRPIVDPIPQIHIRPIVDDDELNFGVDLINLGMGRFERNGNFNYNRHDVSLSLRYISLFLVEILT